jgi:hypothetical protein
MAFLKGQFEKNWQAPWISAMIFLVSRLIMKRRKIVIAPALLIADALLCAAQGKAFTYQGRLNDSGSPANGSYDLGFAIYDANTNGNQIGPDIEPAPEPSTLGLLAVGATALLI